MNPFKGYTDAPPDVEEALDMATPAIDDFPSPEELLKMPAFKDVAEELAARERARKSAVA